MKLAMLSCLMLIAVVACGSEVVTETSDPVPRPAAAVVAESTAIPLTDTQIRECLTAIAVISGYHEHSAPVSVETQFQQYERAPLYGSADVKAPEFAATIGGGMNPWTFKPDLQPIGLLDRHCGGVIDMALAENLLEEIARPPKP